MKKYLKRNKLLISLFTLFVLLSEGLKLMVARLNGRLVDTATSGNEEALYSLFILILVYSLAMPLCFYLYSLFSQIFRLRIQRDMRRDMFEHILNNSYKDYLTREEGAYIANYTTQIKSLDNSYFFSIYGVLQIVFSLLLALIFLYFIHPPFVLYSVIATLPAVFLPGLLKPLISRLQEQNLKNISKNIASLNEFFDGLDTIIFFRSRKRFQKIFFEQNEEVRKIGAKIPIYMLFSVNLSYLILQLYTIVIIFLATVEIAKGNITIGTYIASIHIIIDFTGGLSFATHYIQQFSVAKKTLEHIFSFMEEPEKIELKGGEHHTSETRASKVKVRELESIDFDGVSYSYGEKTLIEDMSYNFKQKGIYQIVGPSGSGKTTLMNLICNYIRAQKGETRINGKDVSEIQNLGEIFTIMRQEAIFFEGTLRDNITMFQNHTDEEITEGLEALGLSYIRPKLDEKNFRLSGGEERRIMLLRALLRDSELLILDEPLANLDEESKTLVENRLKEIRNKFVFVITHEALNLPVIATVRLSHTG